MEKNKRILDVKQRLDRVQQSLNNQARLNNEILDECIVALFSCQEILRDVKYASFLENQPIRTEEVFATQPHITEEILSKKPTPVVVQETISFQETSIPISASIEPKKEASKQVHEVLAKPAVKEVNNMVQSNAFTLDLNDRIYLQRELFNNDSELMRNFLETLSKQASYDLKLQYIAAQNWDLEKESVQRLMQLLEKTLSA